MAERVKQDLRICREERYSGWLKVKITPKKLRENPQNGISFVTML